MKKILLFFLIVVIGYILAIFTVPDVTSQIEEKLGYGGFTQEVSQFRNLLNGIATENEEMIKQNTSSGTQNIVNGVDSVKGTVLNIKDTIEDVRLTLSGAEQKVKNAKQTYDDTMEFLDETGKKIDNAKKALEDLEGLGDIIQNSVNKDIIK